MRVVNAWIHPDYSDLRDRLRIIESTVATVQTGCLATAISAVIAAGATVFSARPFQLTRNQRKKEEIRVVDDFLKNKGCPGTRVRVARPAVVESGAGRQRVAADPDGNAELIRSRAIASCQPGGLAPAVCTA